eukprot:evm.model.NODE_27969_length_46271_cov_24.043224.14
MRRLVEIPWLDEQVGTCTSGSDLEPRRRSIFYKLPPYVRNVDLAREVIVVSNPDVTPLDLGGHYLCDKDNHRFEFEDNYMLAPGADVHVYMCPGKHPVTEEEQPGKLQIVVWQTKDNKPRRREVLDSAGDKITLIDANGVEIAALEVTAAPRVEGEEEEEDNGTAGPEGTKRLYLYSLNLLQIKYAKKFVTFLQGARLAGMILGFMLVLTNNLPSYVVLELLALLLDLAARYIDPLRHPRSRQYVFALIADRLESASLLVVLMTGVLEEDNSYYYAPSPISRVRLGAGMLLVDLLSSWFEVLVESSTRMAMAASDAATPFWKQASKPQAEEAMAVQGGPYRKWLRHYLQRAPWLVTLVTGGNHLFLLMAVARLAQAVEGNGQGRVTQGLLAADRLFAIVPLPGYMKTSWNVLIPAMCAATVYRVLLVWTELMDLIESKV